MIEKKNRLLVYSFKKYWVKVSCMLDPIYSAEGKWFLKGYDHYGLGVRWPQRFLRWKLCLSLWHYWNAISPAVWNTLQPEGPWLEEVCHWAPAFRGHNLLLVPSVARSVFTPCCPRWGEGHSTLMFCSCLGLKQSSQIFMGENFWKYGKNVFVPSDCFLLNWKLAQNLSLKKWN